MATIITKNDGKRQLPFDRQRLERFIGSITERFPKIDAEEFTSRVIRAVESKSEFKAEQITQRLINEAVDRIGTGEGQAPDFTFIASEIYLRKLYKEAAVNRMYDATEKYGDFYALVKELSTKGIYSPKLLQEYSKDEIRALGAIIKPERDLLFTYAGIRTLADRYIARDYDGKTLELPQERFLVITMTLMINEDHRRRMRLVEEAYWALSNLYMTVATPTLSNAGKHERLGQLSSCFIDMVDDSLRGIYDSNTDVALLSKGGGGIGVYIGKLRSKGSDIKGFKGIASGITGWVRQLNNTAVNVDQLGQRQGSIAVYLDVWHKDVHAFLDLKLNNGDERARAHDIFTGINLPDNFMRAVEKRSAWYLFDPHEVKQVMQWRDENGELLGLEDFYDETDEFSRRYEECINHPLLSKERVEAIDIMKRIMRSQLETGTPYCFYRDTVNKANPNKHIKGKGRTSVYSSNLCTEILQNQSATKVIEETTVDGKIIVTKEAGDFVTCNLSSINLARAVTADVLERLIPIQIRMLDNVIDLNEERLEVLQAVLTNRKYRAIGMGGFGWAHLLALKSIKWESEAAIKYADELYEKIAQLAIKASADLAQEKGSYSVFEGSEWNTGEYFTRRGYEGGVWEEVRAVAAKGMRNAWVMATAPNASTAIIAGSTASVDPIFKAEYAEEKKNYKIKVTAPDLNARTQWFYKSAYNIDQHYTIRQAAARGKHIDQGQSLNLYVRNDIKAKDLLELHLAAWREGLKTTYYVRSTAIEIEDCTSCAS